MLANTILCDGKSGVSHEFLFRRSFILATTGQLLPPSFSALYVDHVDGDQVGAGDFFVHPEVLSFPGIREILEGPLNLRRYGPSAQLERFLSAWNLWTAWASPDWDLFWSLTRKIEIENVVELVHRYKRADKISVRSKNHQWISIGCSLLPGEIIPKEGSSVDDEVAIDSGGYHEIDVALLEKLGATRTIKAIEVAKCEWFKEYQSAAIQKYIGSLPAGRQRPQDSFLAFNGQRAYGPLDLLKCMSLPSRSRMVKRLLGPSFYIAHWELFHSTRADKYPRLKFPNPVLWMIHKYGAFETSLGPRLTKECVNPSLAVWRAVLPVADCSQEHARILELPSSLDVLSDNLWIAAFKSVLGLSDMGEAARFYVEACYYRPAPTSILCDVGGKSVEQSVCDVCVTSDHAAFIAAQAANNPILFVEDAEKAKRLHEQWKMPWAIDVEVKFIATGVDELLVDRFPGLIAHLSPSFLELMIRPCESIWIEETNSNGLPDRKILENCAINSPSGLLYPNDWDNPQLLDGLARTLKLDMSGIDRKAILDYLVREERRKCTSAVCAEQAVPEKLLVALGSKALRSGLPVFWNERCNSDQDVANCALAVYGVQVLANYGNELEAAGFNPPKRWAGSRRALEFVRELGIPDQYAGFKSSDYRQPWFEVDGPIRLSPLHPYQELICQRLVQAFQRVPPGRGMVSLPTGAGKTRVVVDAIVRWIDRCQTKQKQTLILWIAQSDELCEQSVQTWSRTWRASGPADCPLRITRMWGRTNQQAENLPYGCHVVIATYQTLRPRTEDRSFLWVFKPDCVVIDEAHGAIAPSYTTILERLGLTYAQTDRCLVGLTATPFRSGEFEDETLRLVRRFASERFDHGVFLNDDPYADLRRQQILATVDHQELEGVDIQLTADEEISFSTYATLPASAERRLGENVGRNKRLIECLKGLDRDWPVIVFAASVEQAKMLSVELCLSGIESRAITGDTEDGVRMHYIQQFKEGKIRILTNYNVLTAGFDAPAVRAVCIARPVFSRVLYQQMIGRGLRGPLNGGKDKCLLINVSDNMSQYGKQLAFRHFEYLWKSGNG
jgi:superfamily II DNA or RNA helicase